MSSESTRKAIHSRTHGAAALPFTPSDMPSSARSNNSSREPPRGRTDPLVGTIIGGEFEIVSLLGSGSHADVFLARQRPIGSRYVALKVLARPYLNLSERDFQRASRALRREAALLGQFHSSCFMDVYAVGALDDERPYLAMELIRGETLKEVISSDGYLDPLTSIEVSLQVAEGLAELHAAGYVHRDVTPSNIMIGRSALGALSCKIVDFGTVTKQIADPDRQRRGYDPLHPLGTPSYMAPEQAMADVVGAAADQFGLGSVMYEMLSGKRTIALATPGPRALLDYLKGAGPIPQESVDQHRNMPPKLAAIVHKSLHRAPQNRFATMIQMADSLTDTKRRAMAVTDIKAPRFLKRIFGVREIDRSEP